MPFSAAGLNVSRRLLVSDVLHRCGTKAFSTVAGASSAVVGAAMWFSMTSTPTTTAAAQPASATNGSKTMMVKLNDARSPAEIQELVAARVRERNAFLIDGSIDIQPSTTEALKFMGSILPQYLTFAPPSPKELDVSFAVLEPDWPRLQHPPPDKIQLTWLGHASVLIQMQGVNIVTDPVFSQRCSPSQWFGPKRFRDPPSTMAQLCDKITIDVCLISHNHYDHLDLPTMLDLVQASPNVKFVLPLGLQSWFRLNVAPNVNVYEMDWYEHAAHNGNALRISCVPVRHWSNRTGDRDATLWCGYVLQASNNLKCFFPGDTAWFDASADLIGTTFGPIDVAMLPCGAYAPREFMKYNHMNVDDAIRMKDAVQARHAVPIHWGTFPLTTEPVLEPRALLVEQMAPRSDADTFAPWQIGETKQFP